MPSRPWVNQPISFQNAFKHVSWYFRMHASWKYLNMSPVSSSITAPVSSQRSCSGNCWDANLCWVGVVSMHFMTESVTSVVMELQSCLVCWCLLYIIGAYGSLLDLYSLSSELSSIMCGVGLFELVVTTVVFVALGNASIICTLGHASVPCTLRDVTLHFSSYLFQTPWLKLLKRFWKDGLILQCSFQPMCLS